MWADDGRNFADSVILVPEYYESASRPFYYSVIVYLSVCVCVCVTTP